MTTPDAQLQDTHSGSRQSEPGYSDTDAQQHPAGNVRDRIDSPEVGLPVDDGEPSGEQNGEEREPGESESDEREED